MCRKLCRDLKNCNGITVYCNGNFDGDFAPVLSLNDHRMNSDEVAAYLSEHGVAVRGGYHCAPLAHKTLGTYKMGTVRLSPGITSCVSDVEYVKKLLLGLANKNI